MDAIEILRCPSCWSDFTPEPLTGSLFEVDGFGTLTCECGIFPVIDGIPVLDRRHNEQRLVALIKQGAFSTATSECLMVDVQRGRAPRLFWRLLRKFDVSNGLYERIRVCRTFREALRIGVPTASAYHEYLRCRFSDPTFVAGEWLLANTQPTSGWLLDVPAGAGHFSWTLRQRHPHARIVTADRFVLLHDDGEKIYCSLGDCNLFGLQRASTLQDGSVRTRSKCRRLALSRRTSTIPARAHACEAPGSEPCHAAHAQSGGPRPIRLAGLSLLTRSRAC